MNCNTTFETCLSIWHNSTHKVALEVYSEQFKTRQTFSPSLHFIGYFTNSIAFFMGSLDCTETIKSALESPPEFVSIYTEFDTFQTYIQNIFEQQSKRHGRRWLWWMQQVYFHDEVSEDEDFCRWTTKCTNTRVLSLLQGFLSNRQIRVSRKRRKGPPGLNSEPPKEKENGNAKETKSPKANKRTQTQQRRAEA